MSVYMIFFKFHFHILRALCVIGIWNFSKGEIDKFNTINGASESQRE
jgi:hypothetical protein